MHDKSNKNTPKSQRVKIAVFMSSWASELFTHRSFEENLQLVLTLKEAYLCSDWANDKQERIDVLMLFEHLEKLFSTLETYDHKDFKELDEWVLKMTA